jgi:nitrite reductase (cytochrome c-552)
MSTIAERIKEKPWIGWVLFISTMIVVFLLGLFTYTIMERQTEAQFAHIATTDLDPLDPRAEAWREFFPRQFDTYREMADTTFRSKYLGSYRKDLLEAHPQMVILFAGYGFSKDYNLARGHIYSIQDPRETLRTGAPMEPEEGPMPATCWTCKSPDVPRVMNDIGPADFYSQTFAELGHEIVNPINCASCHDAEDMSLKIALPALAEAFDRLGKDVNNATHQEMRNLACAQCHVEYYFGEDNYLIFPWDEGMTAEEMAEYYDQRQFADWIHPLSKTPMIKAQHPDYEVFTTGIHYERGVSCSDCHMPFKTEGAMKFTDHQIQSPLSDVSASCQTCHRESEADLVQNVYDRQDMVYNLRDKLADLLVITHLEAEFAWNQGATEDQMREALHKIRHAQWRWDYAAATHGGAFHAPLELVRTLGDGLDLAHEARREVTAVLTELGWTQEVPLPDVSTKQKAQEYIGIDLQQLEAEKQEFMKEVVPQWVQKARERQQMWEERREKERYEGNYIQPEETEN